MNDAIIALGGIGLVCGGIAFVGILLRIVAVCGAALLDTLKEEE